MKFEKKKKKKQKRFEKDLKNTEYNMTTLLYTYWRSSCSWRVRLALHLKGIAFEPRFIHLVKGGGENNTEEYAKVNPARQVPALHIDGTTIAQSLAIIEYLETTRPEVALIPKDAARAAKARQIALTIGCEIQPLQNSAVLQKIEKEHGADKRTEWAQFYIAKGLKVVEQLVQECGGKYCAGDEISVADICLVPQLYNARRFNVDLSPFPNLLRIETLLAEHPAFVAAHPDNQPDKDA